MFVSGEHYDCHPYIVHPDGTGLRKIADRGGHKGFVTVYDVYDFHNGSSDVPVWSADGKHVIYTALIGGAVELMRVSLDGAVERLTKSPESALNYHPKPSPDGTMLAFGSTRTGTRQLYVMPNDGGEPQAITQVPEGYGAMWAHWQP
jgi:Tol biopolymer transport system component